MVWAAADAAVKMIERFGDAGPADRWRKLRAEVRSDVLDRGYDAGGETFVQHYSGSGLDASSLRLVQLGFLPPSDERMSGTVAAIARELDRGGVLLRYQQDPADSLDGLPPDAGGYLPAAFWLAQCYALMGRGGAARRAFASALELRNDVGLLPEEYDPLRRRFTGNFPLTGSHAAAAATAAALDSMDAPAGAARFTRTGRGAGVAAWTP
jgi:GH15 family glucan-1,4-alpha-glucosidase